MAPPQLLSDLNPREAVADALYRAILGIDSSDRAMFESGCVTDETAVLETGKFNLQGWEAIGKLFDRAFALTTTHFATNLRIQIKDEKTASLTANVIAYHVKPGTEHDKEDTSYTAGTMYDLDLVKDAKDGLWKIRKWGIKSNWSTGDRSILHGES